MAIKLGVSKSTYSRWETGKKVITFEHLLNLCNITKLSIDYTLSTSNEKVYYKNKTIFKNKINQTKKRKNHKQSHKQPLKYD